MHNRSLANLITTCRLVDPLAKQHKSWPFPATYNRGRSWLDYLLVSSLLLPAIHRSGILPYQSVFHSDHRPYFLDIDSTSLFGDATSDMSPPCRRQLQLHDPQIVEQYCHILHQQLQYHKIPEKIVALRQTLSAGQWTKHNRTSYEKIDKLITEAMLHAERKSRKKYTGTFAWSPELI